MRRPRAVSDTGKALSGERAVTLQQLGIIPARQHNRWDRDRGGVVGVSGHLPGGANLSSYPRFEIIAEGLDPSFNSLVISSAGTASLNKNP